MTFYRVFITALLVCPHIPIRTVFTYFPLVSDATLVPVTAETQLCSGIWFLKNRKSDGTT